VGCLGSPDPETAELGKRTYVSSCTHSAGSAESAVEQNRATPAVDELERVYREHHDFVWRNARRLGCPSESVDDVTHEVFLVVARRLVEFEHRSSERTWLFAITYHTVRRWLRDSKRRQHGHLGFALVQLVSSSPHQKTDAAETLHRLLSDLNESERVVFILCELEGMTAVEVGEFLALRPCTVDSRLRTARGKLSRLAERERQRERSQP
jgi:RNA polymerase sigma-70 factor, ECF subfamily